MFPSPGAFARRDSSSDLAAINAGQAVAVLMHSIGGLPKASSSEEQVIHVYPGKNGRNLSPFIVLRGAVE